MAFELAQKDADLLGVDDLISSSSTLGGRMTLATLRDNVSFSTARAGARCRTR